MTDDEKILEWCGLSKRGGYWWYDSSGKHLSANNLPQIDLNFYFKYAVPVLGKLGFKFVIRFNKTFLVRFYKERYDCVAVFEHEDLAEAFRQALLKLIKEEK